MARHIINNTSLYSLQKRQRLAARHGRKITIEQELNKLGLSLLAPPLLGRTAATDELKTYTVVWRIEVYAESAADACRQALKIQRDPDSLATFFEVKEEIDLSEGIEVSDSSS